MTWKTIDTAPKDGTWVLLTGGQIDYGWRSSYYDKEENQKPVCFVGQYRVQNEIAKEFNIQPGWQVAWYDSGYYGDYENPTHWLPLPNLP